ncbi:hypothetical protein EPUS_03353 [Endocarpon pusillum Z07020]|uniref:Sodium/calcium exchanger membrane region domain-containing protein n=1 Tax=Endocarpon pusillum (strain Z07020 / HMAS-L-300199) TaxID=1263415 RepID=U1G1F7_ENDPU|nr:uncharacterized protein EPUS_03353 [Endocarpon pusillum Z07020]ERF71072.1 hypothetical protein EPUS_03353 [Endocarpon pusillum Z07020]
MTLFSRKRPRSSDAAQRVSQEPFTTDKPSKHHMLPTHYNNGRLVTKGIQQEGESGRSGFNPVHFCKVAWRSSCRASMFLNVLWPFVPAGIALYYSRRESTLLVFAINYVAMIPAANLLGFAGQDLARKLPRVLGILLETTLSAVVEIVLFVVLIVKDHRDGHNVAVIKAAILGSILTNLLLCLGCCFFLGGIKRHEQVFHEAVSEVGSNLLLVAGFALLIPSAFYSALHSSAFGPGDEVPTGEDGRPQEVFTLTRLNHDILAISRGTAIVLIVAFILFIWYNAKSHDTIFDDVLAADQEKDVDREHDLSKAKFTLTECIMALAVSLALVSIIAVILVNEIHPMVVEYRIPDNFMGLILVPLVEKFAEHITAIDEAWDNQMNFALFHCLGPSIQTALFNAPLVVLVGWGLHNHFMDLNFEIFQIVLLVLSIMVVGNFLRDKKSNYLEGGLLVLIYVIVALSAWYYPNPSLTTSNSGATGIDSH